VVDHILELLNLSLTHLKLLVPLHKLGFEVVDIVQSKSHFIMGVLYLGAGDVEGIGLEVAIVVCLHQLIVQLLVVHFEDVSLLE
jgi:hypothetical protein